MRYLILAVCFFGLMKAQAQDILLSGEPAACEGDTLFATALSDAFFFWNTGAKSNELAITASGSYFYTYDGPLGVLNSDTLEVLFHPNPLPVSNPNPVSCFGAQDGNIEVFNTAGVPMASVLWSNGASGQIIFGLAPGTYDYTVIDVNGCQTSGSESVVGPEEILLNIDVIEQEEGLLVSVDASGGSAPYQFFWNGALGEANHWVEELPLLLSVVDLNDCSADSLIALSGLEMRSFNTHQTNGVYFFAEESELRLYPKAQAPKRLMVYSRTGQLIASLHHPQFPIKLDLNPGVWPLWRTEE